MCLVAQSCLTLCNPLDCSLPGSSVHGIFQARILEWVAISFSRGYSQPRDQTCISCLLCTADGFFNCWAIRETCEISWETSTILYIYLFLFFCMHSAGLWCHFLNLFVPFYMTSCGQVLFFKYRLSFLLFICLLLVALGLRRCMWAFCSSCEPGLLFVAVGSL